MATSSYDSTWGIRAETVNIPAGATLAVYYGQIARQNDIVVKPMGASNVVLIQATSVGSTMPGASIAALFAAGSYYALGSSEVMQLGGPASFYVAAIGATALVSVMRAMSQNASDALT